MEGLLDMEGNGEPKGYVSEKKDDVMLTWAVFCIESIQNPWLV
jgi:hypothetical protein